MNELNKKAAELMGIDIKNKGSTIIYEFYDRKKEETYIESEYREWNPVEDLNQAFMLLTKFDDEVLIEKEKEGSWFVQIHGYAIIDKTPALAIVKAALKVKEGE